MLWCTVVRVCYEYVQEYVRCGVQLYVYAMSTLQDDMATSDNLRRGSAEGTFKLCTSTNFSIFSSFIHLIYFPFPMPSHSFKKQESSCSIRLLSTVYLPILSRRNIYHESSSSYRFTFNYLDDSENKTDKTSPSFRYQLCRRSAHVYQTEYF